MPINKVASPNNPYKRPNRLINTRNIDGLFLCCLFSSFQSFSILSPHFVASQHCNISGKSFSLRFFLTAFLNNPSVYLKNIADKYRFTIYGKTNLRKCD